MSDLKVYLAKMVLLEPKGPADPSGPRGIKVTRATREIKVLLVLQGQPEPLDQQVLQAQLLVMPSISKTPLLP
jgi:hypothetical protein